MIEASVVGIRVINEWSWDRFTTPYQQPNSRTIEDNRSTISSHAIEDNRFRISFEYPYAATIQEEVDLQAKALIREILQVNNRHPHI